MKKSLVILALVAVLQMKAQDPPKTMTPRAALIEFNGAMYNGNIADIEAPADLVENAIKERFKSQGVKGKEIKGFMVYRNIRVDRIDSVNPIDAFVKVEGKGKRGKEGATISLITSPVGQISDEKVKSGVSTAEVTAVALTGVFFNDIAPDIDNKVFEKNVSEQEEQVKKSEKKLKDLQQDQVSKEKKIKSIQDELQENRKDQEAMTQELEKKRNALNLLLSQKPGGKN